MNTRIPFLTIAMPVRNEARFIEETLYELVNQDYPGDRYEIIVADAESVDDTRSIVKEMAKKYPQIKLFSNPGKLPSSGRNVGFKNGKGDLFLVVDGHCRIRNNKLLRNVADAFERTGAQCLGRSQPFVIPEEPSWQRAIAIARSSNLGHSGNSYIHADEEAYVSPVSMGCAYKKEVFENIGFVDESFDACEDVEFNYRVERAGYKTFFTPKIAIQYFPRETVKGLWQQLVRYGEGRARFILKHPETFNFDMLLPIVFSTGLVLGGLSYFIALYLFAAYLGTIILYFIIILYNSIKLRKREPLSFIPKLMITFLVIHFSLGYGIIKGFIKRLFGNAKPEPSTVTQP